MGTLLTLAILAIKKRCTKKAPVRATRPAPPLPPRRAEEEPFLIYEVLRPPPRLRGTLIYGLVPLIFDWPCTFRLEPLGLQQTESVRLSPQLPWPRCRLTMRMSLSTRSLPWCSYLCWWWWWSAAPKNLLYCLFNMNLWLLPQYDSLLIKWLLLVSTNQTSRCKAITITNPVIDLKYSIMIMSYDNQVLLTPLCQLIVCM